MIYVLLIEDNEPDARLIEVALADLGASFSVKWVTSTEKGLESLIQEDVHVVLLDLSLPDSQGLESFMTMNAAAPAIPIIVLSGIFDEHLAIESVQKGAQDYYEKGALQANPGFLARAIRHAIERKKLVYRLSRLAVIPENSPNAIFEIKGTTQITYLNPAAHRAFPALPELGENHFLLEGLGEIIQDLQSKPPEQRSHVRSLNKDDRVYEHHVVCVPDSDLVHNTIIDITRRNDPAY